MSERKLQLFGREDCRLCDYAAAALHQACEADAWERFDIDDDPAWSERYAVRIPVLVDSKGRELDWPFDAYDIRRWLEAAR